MTRTEISPYDHQSDSVGWELIGDAFIRSPESEDTRMMSRADVIREMLGEYEYELSVARSRLDNQQLRRAKLELARQVLVEHGETEEADRLKLQIHELDDQVVTSQELIEKLEGLISTYRRALDKVQA